VRVPGLATHYEKRSTPTGAGVLMTFVYLVGIFVFLFYGGRSDVHTMMVYTVTWLLFAFIGTADDWCKIYRGRGISERTKWYSQWAAAVAVILLLHPIHPASWIEWLSIPSGWYAQLLTGGWYAFLLVAVSNAVNLTDGLDGLAAQVLIPNYLLYGLYAACWCAHDTLGWLLILTAGIIEGFRWFNKAPARIFMGDSGSLSLGACLALAACMLRREWFLLITACVPVLETLSVIVQVVSLRLMKRRIFRMAPLHHHYEVMGYSETTIVRAATVITWTAVVVTGCVWWFFGPRGIAIVL
jgi:phospho-N-acetylmuramoyl-pentapeptide-transferase